ncbi:MAG: LamG domain-containing protein [Limisphaera sp.]|nr:LamG domain-containing protein [Limisphaera sp.]
MDDDLRDVLTVWSGSPLDEARYEALLARLRSDAAFRQACARELHMLGMLKVVQAPSPRWLRLEEELRPETATTLPEPVESLEGSVMAALHRSIQPWKRWLAPAVAAGAAGLLMALGLWTLTRRAPAPPVPLHLRDTLGVVVQIERAVWDPATELRPRRDDLLEPGWLRLRSGLVSLALFNGVRLHVEGPAALQLRSLSYVFCEQGRLAVHVPPQSEIKDFTIASPGAAIRDMGTEFGFNVYPDRPAELLVFRGAAEASVLAPNGTTLRSEVLPEHATARIVPERGAIERTALPTVGFVQPPRVDTRPLRLSPDYPRAVMTQRPWAYWRFEEVIAGTVPSGVPGSPALRLQGNVRLREVGSDNTAAFFDPRQAAPYLESAEPWEVPSSDYAIEFLFSSEQYKNSALVSLLTGDDRHLAMVELTAREPEHLVHKPGTLRFVHRSPPATYGGVNLFSTRVFFPYRWHHIVAQRRGHRLELYIDGALATAAEVDLPRTGESCRILLGRLRYQPVPPEDIRCLAGYLDEVALYPHALSPETISLHATLAGCGESARASAWARR